MCYLVSACLLGKNCKYNSSNNLDKYTIDFIAQKKFIALCPEVLGGLGVPRPRTELQKGTGEDVLQGTARIVNEKGADVTDSFISGAYAVLEHAQKEGCTKAILKARSPSCGYGMIYDGSFSGTVKKGNGVLAALLYQKGFSIQTEEDLQTPIEG